MRQESARRAAASAGHWMRRWKLRADGPAFSTPFGSRLAPVLNDDGPAMLKIAAGDEEERGAAAMEWWDGEGAARVLARDGPALLLERVVGSRSLSAMARGGQDDEATAILCGVAMRLHGPRDISPPASLVPLEIWFRALAPAADRFGGILRESARTARDLLDANGPPVVLHGDIHHANVLDGGARGWLAIDPKGLLGERTFDFANLLCNPGIEVAGAPGRLETRVAIVARETGLAPTHLLSWLLAWAGLSAAWTLADGEDASPALEMARLALGQLRA